MIEAAVARLPDDFHREQWLAWSRAHTEVLRAGDPAPAAAERVPHYAAVAAISALDLRKAQLSDRLAVLDEDADEACDIEGDISLIDMIETRLTDMLHEEAHQAA